MKDQISGSRLLKRLGMAYECKDCPNKTGPYGVLCGLSSELMNVCDAITDLMDEGDEPVKPTIFPLDKELPEAVKKAANEMGEAIGEFINAIIDNLTDEVT